MIITLQKGSETIKIVRDKLASPLVKGWWINVPGHSGQWKIIDIEET